MKKIPIHTGEEIDYFDRADIICFEGDGRYTYVYIEKQKGKKGVVKQLVSRNLKYFERELRSRGFQRSHKKWIVNLTRVTKLKLNGFVMLRNCPVKYIPVSRRYRKALRKRIEMIRPVPVK